MTEKQERRTVDDWAEDFIEEERLSAEHFQPLCRLIEFALAQQKDELAEVALFPCRPIGRTELACGGCAECEGRRAAAANVRDYRVAR